MSYLVGNSEDRFSHEEAQMCLNEASWVQIKQIFAMYFVMALILVNY